MISTAPPKIQIDTMTAFARLLKSQILLIFTDCDEEKFQFAALARRPDFPRLCQKSRGCRNHARLADARAASRSRMMRRRPTPSSSTPVPSLTPRRRRAWTQSSNPSNCATRTGAVRQSSFPAASRSDSGMNCPNSCRKWTPSWALIKSRKWVTSWAGRWKAGRRKLGKHSTSNIQHPTSKGKISARLTELEKKRDVSKHEEEESLRGTEKFGKTKTVVAASRQSAVISLQEKSQRRTPEAPLQF